MNYYLKLFFILFLVSSIIFSKDSDGNIYKKDYKLSIHTSIMRPFDAYNPAMQAGFDFYFTDKISFQFDGGIIIPSSIEETLFTNEPSKHKGYRIETQLKYWIFYINSLPISHCFSLSLHPFYINNYWSYPKIFRAISFCFAKTVFRRHFLVYRTVLTNVLNLIVILKAQT